MSWSVVFLVVAALVLVVAAVVATRPAEFRVARSRQLAAPPSVVFPHLNDFHRWPGWSPWEKLDPGMTREVTGPAQGPGASYHWSGNNKVGEGRMTITESQEPTSVTLRLEFLRPWKATNVTRFDLVPSGTGTEATWAMTGRHTFMSKAMGLFVDMDTMVGPDFEKGLAGLDAVTALPAEGSRSA